jgi:hypothetical protein
MPDHAGDRGAVLLELGASRSPPYQAEECVTFEVADELALLPVVALLEEVIAAHRLVVHLIKSK